LECGDCDIARYPLSPRPVPASFGNRKDPHIQPIVNKENILKRFWSVQEVEERILENGMKIGKRLVAKLPVIHEKRGLTAFKVGCLTIQRPIKIQE
jgi:hypothetical protein